MSIKSTRTQRPALGLIGLLLCSLALTTLTLPAAQATSLAAGPSETLQAFRASAQAGTVLAPPASLSATMQDLLLGVSGEGALKGDEGISQFSRCVYDTGHNQAAEYLKAELKKLGYEPLVQTFPGTAATRGAGMQNIVVRRAGTNPKATHLLTAHWDSSPVRAFPPVCNNVAPGANDNGSGAAVLLELARLLALGRASFQDDLELALFDGEEFGYLGSQYFVQTWADDRRVNPQNLPLGTIVNLDMVGYSRGKEKGEVWAIAEGEPSVALAREGADLVASYLPGVRYGTYTIGDKFPAGRDPNRNSDQRAFWESRQGQAIFLSEDVADIYGADPRYHTPLDKFRETDGSVRLDPALLADSGRVALLIVGTKAGIRPGPFFAGVTGAFEKVWGRADRPVWQGAHGGPNAGRGWLWGPGPNLARVEPYDQAEAGYRQVVYWDKARMELADPATGRVTNGLLVTEMTTGQLQLGDNRFLASPPSTLQVAGDSNERGQNSDAPTYASFRALVAAGGVKDVTGTLLTATLNRAGQVGQRSAPGLIRNAFFVGQTGHNIPDVFWNWFASQGRIYDAASDSYQNGAVLDWLSTVGLPISEAYWIRTRLGGVERDVLVQLFERRVLTYTPTNDPPWQVEMGNVGQHYLTWRYPQG